MPASRASTSASTPSIAPPSPNSRRDRLVDVLAGIAAAKAAGLAPVKINSVLVRGVNDHEAPTLLRWALAEGVRLRFIEHIRRWMRATSGAATVW